MFFIGETNSPYLINKLLNTENITQRGISAFKNAENLTNSQQALFATAETSVGKSFQFIFLRVCQNWTLHQKIFSTSLVVCQNKAETVNY